MARTPDGRLSPALFNPAPRTPGRTLAAVVQAHISRAGGAPGAVSSAGGPLSTTGSLEHLGVHGGARIRPVFSLIHEQPLASAPDAACVVTDGAGAPVLAIMCAAEQQVYALALPWYADGWPVASAISAGSSLLLRRACASPFCADATSHGSRLSTGCLPVHVRMGAGLLFLCLQCCGSLMLLVVHGSRAVLGLLPLHLQMGKHILRQSCIMAHV